MKTKVDDIPEPGEPPQPIEPELEEALTWFMAMQKDPGWRRFVWGLGADDLVVTPERIELH